MSADGFALFLHLAALMAAFILSGMLHISEYQVRYAGTVDELRLVTRPFKYGPLFAPLLIVIVGAGSWLVSLSDDAFSMGDGWVVTGMVASLVLFVDGPVVMGRHGAELGKALAAAPAGTASPELRAVVCAPVPWMVGHANTAGVLGVIYAMVNKTSGLESALIVVGAAVIGAVVGNVRAKKALAGV